MRRLVLFAFIAFFLFTCPVFAGTVGPVKSSLSAGQFSLGLGYTHTRVDWENNDASLNITTAQNLFFGEVDLGLGGGWATYVRVGGASFDADDAFLLGADFEGEDIMPFATFGLGGIFFDGALLKVGPFLQGSYFFLENQDEVNGQAVINGNPSEAAKETVTFEKMWEAKAGFSFQVELEGAQLYAGPMYFHSEADYTSAVVGASGAQFISSATLEDQSDFGWVAGIQWKLVDGMTLDFEAQKRSDYDIGLVLKKSF